MGLLGGVIGLSTTVLLKAHLTGNLQAQLRSTADFAVDPYGAGPQSGPHTGPQSGAHSGSQSGSQVGPHSSALPSPDPNRGGVAFLTSPGQLPGTVAAETDALGKVTSSGVSERNSAFQLPLLTTAQQAALTAVRTDSDLHTVALPGLGDYMVLAQVLQDGQRLYVGVPLQSVESTVNELVAIEAVITVLGVIGAALATAAVIRLSLRPLDRVAATAARISRLPLDQGEVAELVRVPEADTDARTEAGQVGASLNRLIDHVSAALTARHASETRVRQFVADASHELRTPLASIGGYAELTRRGRDSVPPDTAYALSRIESEAGRMTRLVEDLLLLARLDAGRPLERQPVDVPPLVVDAVRDAHAAVPDHRWKVELPDGPVVVGGDPHRLHQVLVNLLANAGKHTPAGTTVTASVTAADGSCVVRITDDGPGIPPELLPSVFERFARGDHSRSRAAGSTGLGLAIVAAVVGSHRGMVEVASEPGNTVFTVRLPTAEPDAEPDADPAARPAAATAAGGVGVRP
ncbi:HAMP domain-containing histidine kinase [Streptacidiphilus sp. PB12-B1b]|nr:HAMP domain-containing histidine kinase [Streptacidiphilus sp. PB12-B1b]